MHEAEIESDPLQAKQCSGYNIKKEHFHKRAAWLGLITSSRSRELREAARFPSTSEAAICVEPQGFNASWKPRAQKSEEQSRVWTAQHVLKCILHSMTTHSHGEKGQFTNLVHIHKAKLWQGSCLQAFTPRIAHLRARCPNLSALLLALTCTPAPAPCFLGDLFGVLIQRRLRLSIGLLSEVQLRNICPITGGCTH